jgi:hypothetical protein
LKLFRLSSAVLALLIAGISTPAQMNGGHRKIFTAAAGPSAFAYVAGTVTGCVTLGAGATRCAYNLHVNPTAGHLGVVSVEWSSTTATASFACTNNGAWTAIGSPKAGAGGQAGNSGQLFYIASMVAGAGPELCTLTISSTVSIILWEYAEYSYSGTLSTLNGTPQYSNTAASGGVATISGLTTTGSGNLVLAACIGVDSTCTVGAGYTARNDTNACQGVGSAASCGGGSTGHDFNGETGGLLEEKTGVGAGAQTATFGTGTTDAVILGLVAF